MSDIIFERRGRLAIVTLNRPAAMNAQNFDMVQDLALQLAEWEEDPTIDRLLLRGAGERAFCAGGDVRALWALPYDEQLDFFETEYALCHRLSKTRLITIAYMDGVTMGGGVGLSIFADYRVATARTVWAMPEAQIGFFPDIAATWFLPRLKAGRGLGRYLALTGSRLSGADCLASGIATDFIAPVKDDVLVQLLAEADDVGAALRGLAEHPGAANVIDLAQALHPLADLALPDFVAALSSQGLLPAGLCLPSLTIIDAMMAIAARLSLAATVDLDGRVVRHFLRGATFREGVRARLIDRDNRPNWPQTLDMESAKLLNYFEETPDSSSFK